MFCDRVVTCIDFIMEYPLEIDLRKAAGKDEGLSALKV